MNAKLCKNIIFILFFIFTSSSYGDNHNSNRIEVLVNENVITKFDIVQRMKVNSILKRTEINENNYNQLIEAVVDDLIVESLKNHKISEYDINYGKDEFVKQEERFYVSIDYKKKDLEELFNLNDINFDNLLKIIETELKWQKLIYGLFLRVTSVTDQEINDVMIKNPNISKEIASELILQKQLEIKSAKLIKDLRDEATIEYK